MPASFAPRVLLLLLSFASIAVAQEMQIPASAETCGDCHRAIHQGWKRSAHSQAMENRLFQDALKLAETELGSGARRTCLSCHSPVGSEIGDVALQRKVSWEGVTCEYCHSIRSVTFEDGKPKAHVQISRVKSGPSKDSVSPAHGVEFSAVHTSSMVCISCHEYKNAQSFSVITTYTEWKDSKYAKDEKNCQSCHMYAVLGNVVDPRVKRSPAEINLHEMPGSRSTDQLNKAISASLRAQRNAGKVEVAVRLTNAGAGHSVPTGSPMRRMILEVCAIVYGGKEQCQQKSYARTVAGRDGKPLKFEHVAFIRASQALSDTRLAAGETRNEAFQFPVAPNARVRVEANLYYYYSPMASSEAEQKKKFLSMNQWVQ